MKEFNTNKKPLRVYLNAFFKELVPLTLICIAMIILGIFILRVGLQEEINNGNISVETSCERVDYGSLCIVLFTILLYVICCIPHCIFEAKKKVDL